MRDSSSTSQTCLPTTTWFLYSEAEDAPLGSIYRKSPPEAGARIEERPGIPAAEVVSFTELRAT
jgi:hypothetical protein